MPKRANNGYPGVINRGTYIQLDLRSLGKGKVPIYVSPTAENLKAASRKRDAILRQAKGGILILAEHLPGTPAVDKDAASQTLLEYGQQWLAGKKPEIAYSTWMSYGYCITAECLANVVGSVRMGELNRTHVKALLDALPKVPKTRNEYVYLWKTILTNAERDGLAPVGITIDFRRWKRQHPQPDPFSIQDVDAVVRQVEKDFGAKAANYFEFAFWTGLRPSEQLGLPWQAVDFHNRRITVYQARVRRFIKGTKTNLVRVVELNERAYQCLKRQQELTFQAGKEFVFEDDEGNHLMETRQVIESWWMPAMKATGLRYRSARQTRHTYATIMLMAGATPNWAAAQLGHSLEMFTKTYSRWIVGADQRLQVDRVDEFENAVRKRLNSQSPVAKGPGGERPGKPRGGEPKSRK